MNAKREIGFVVSIVFLLLLIVANIEIYRMSGLFTVPTISVSVESESKGVFYEFVSNDTKFQIGPLNLAETWYSYNGSYGGIQAGYDLDFDGKTQTFTLRNDGGIIADVTITANDFSNINDSSEYIDVDKDSGYVRVYIPGDGWERIPDYDDEDADLSKNDEELCIANDLYPGDSITGIDFEVKAPSGLASGNYTGQVVLTYYDNSSYSPCSGVGTYVTP